MNHWRTTSKELVSKGSIVRPQGLAGLADARDEHHGQFWTPAELSRSLWQVALPYLNRIVATGRKAVLLDNAFGSGSLWSEAHPEEHILMGTETDKKVFNAVDGDSACSGFETILKHESMFRVRFAGADIAIINPPFSLTFSSPDMPKYPTSTFGKYGPQTQSRSHTFAISQALEAAPVVIAIIPAGFLSEAVQLDAWRGRLGGAFLLPGNAFAEENVDYPTGILVFKSVHKGAVARGQWNLANQPAIDLSDEPASTLHVQPEIIEQVRRRTVKTPVTGDRRVSIAHDGRKLVLKFRCGQVEAKVLKALYGEPIGDDPNNYRKSKDVDQLRRPRGYDYCGDSLFDLEHYIATDDPLTAFRSLFNRIESLGAEPAFAPGFINRIRNLIRIRRREAIPFARVVFEDAKRASLSDGLEAGRFRATCKKNFICNPTSWGSPAIPSGEVITFTRDEGNLCGFDWKGKGYVVALPRIHEHFDVETVAEAGRWKQIFDGKGAHCPEVLKNEASRAKALGIDQWLWDYQWEDLLELRLVEGSILGYDMGLGKARMALALCLLGGARNLIVVEAHLVDEMLEEIEKIGIDSKLFQVFRKAGDLSELRRINIISYSRLRMPIAKGARRTYAAALRRRVCTVVADEAHCLRNQKTQQTRALHMLSARRKYALTGTPIANYPRDLLPLVVWSSGEATAAQPYGYHRPFVTKSLVSSARYAVRGVDKFRSDFVTLEWVSNEFQDELEGGAKREIPKIANLPAYREFASKFIKRRVREEPAVKKYINMPAQKSFVHSVEWDAGHFSFYKEISDEFAAWYRRTHDEGDKRVNLIALLRRIEAVIFAANLPSKEQDGFGSYGFQTSKERAVLDKIEEFAAQGHRTIVFARSPKILARLKRDCEARGIDSGIVHGQIPQTQRTATIRMFKDYKLPVLFGSFGVTQTGLNLYQADRVIFVQRDWTAKTENQAKARVLRPQQKAEVEFHFFHLEGSIDEYQAQMVAHKNDSACAGLDFAEPEMADEEFLHLDTIMGRFVADHMGAKAAA
jgi:hypothetical protein